MSLDDLNILPRVRDSWSYVYVERCRVDQHDKAIAIHDVGGSVQIPCAAIVLLMCGPGTTVTHAAIKTLAENGCLLVWTGEAAVRMYAVGLGETRSSRNLLRQAALVSDPALRLAVVRRMYQARFDEVLAPELTLQQIRGMEGARVRDAYARASNATGVPWAGRSYKRDDWRAGDPINRALSAANACLYGVCHAAIVSAGYSPALGFVHTGKMLSFVYDIADLYKAQTSIPAAFRAVAAGAPELEGSVRRHLRDVFFDVGLMKRIVTDLDRVLDVPTPENQAEVDTDPALPGALWDPDAEVDGGANYAETES